MDVGYVVIGAGMAGLATARALADAGRDAVVVEARGRIGGRVYTPRIDRDSGRISTIGADPMWADGAGQTPVDLGASWIHGITGNPIAELARQYSIATAPGKNREPTFIGPDGARLPRKKLVGTLDRTLDRAATLAWAEPSDLSLSDAIARVRKTRDHRKGAALDLGLSWLSLIMGTDIDTLSARHWDQDDELGGGDVVFPGGYDHIPRALVNDLDIWLDSPVTEIARDGEHVRITTDSRTVSADAVIVTVPLGVLKARTISFVPDLPDKKWAAVDRLGVGLLNKIALVITERFWPRQLEQVVVAPQREPDITGFSCVQTTEHPVLLAWLAGRTARLLEARSDSELADMAIHTVSRTLGRPAPDPAGVLVSRWASDPHSMGSYSYIPVGATGREYDHLAEPIRPWLYFAGEACHRAHPGTVHGAYLSGQEAAAAAMADEPDRPGYTISPRLT